LGVADNWVLDGETRVAWAQFLSVIGPLVE
jgi:hypothetical protein